MPGSTTARAARATSATVTGQSRAIAKARDNLALRHELEARLSRKQRAEAVTLDSDVAAAAAAGDEAPVDSETLVREAHRVLLRYLPAAALPDELWKVRALLDHHMFGRDGRVHRDDVVRVARQIDRSTESE